MVHDELLQKHCLQLMQLIYQGVELKDILEQIIRYIENRFNSTEVHTAFFGVDMHKEKLNHLASSSSLDQPVDFEQQFEKLYFAKLNDQLQQGKTVTISEDEGQDLLGEVKTILPEMYYESAITIPLHSSYQYLVGVLFILFRKKYKPDLTMLQILQQYNKIATIAIKLARLTEQKQKEALPKGINIHTVTDEAKQVKELENALANDQFKIYYQPYYGLKKKEFGLEALIRWKHPTYGLLSPASFLDVAEKSGFIIDLEDWVLKRAIADVKDLEKDGMKNIELSVNVSAKQFENAKYPKKVIDVLDKYKLDPNQLTLEITERFLVEEKSVSGVENIKDLGVRISIDDFGTSYSSLYYLKDLPVDELKIDRSFISTIDANFNDKKIVEMIIMLSHQLNLTTVAEGIETKEQFDILKQINCDRVQGFLFSKPIPINKVAPEYEKYLNRFYIE